MKEHLNYIIQHQSHPGVFITPEGKVEFINQPALNVLELNREACVGEYFHLITSDVDIFLSEEGGVDIRNVTCPVYEAVLTQKSIYKNDDVFWKQDGSVFNVEYYADPFFEKGQFIGAMIGFHDISAQLIASNILKDNEERQRLIVENSITAIISIDSDGQVIDWNKQAETIFGWTKAEALERQLTEMIIPSPFVSAHNKGLAEFFKTGEIKSQGRFIELEAKRKNGEKFSIEISLFPFVTRFGQHIVCATCQDVTDRKLFLQELVQANERSLAASRSKSDFLSNMSHEIRTPLTSILGFAEAIQKNTQMDRDVLIDSVDTIVSNGKHLLSLINDILDYSKIEAGKLELEDIDFNLEALVENIVSMISPQMNLKGLDFIAEIITPCPVIVKSDPTRIRQVLLNLLGNAIKFTEKGFIRLTITFDQMKQELVFALIDSGIGISESGQEKLFQSFNQEDNSVSRKYGGTGLGLSISKRLCELLGGNLQVQSTQNAGSIFYFNMQIDLQEEIKSQGIARIWINDPEKIKKKEKVEKVKALSVYPGHSVLLAEDTPSNQKLISMHLRNMQLDYEIVENGKLAVDAALVKDYDLILMDMQMPVMGGIEATEMLRMTGYDAPIVALTANVMAHDREKFEAAGCDDFLPKPLDIEKIYAVMDKYLVASSASDQLSKFSIEDSPEFKVLVKEFEESLSLNQQKMCDYLKNQDYKNIQSLAHQLKGAGTSFGYPELSVIGKDLEVSAKNHDQDESERLIELIKTQIN